MCSLGMCIDVCISVCIRMCKVNKGIFRDIGSCSCDVVLRDFHCAVMSRDRMVDATVYFASGWMMT